MPRYRTINGTRHELIPADDPRLVAANEPYKPVSAELGVSGAAPWQQTGLSTELSKLSGKAGLQIYDRMFKSDGTVHAVINMLTWPIRALEVDIDAGGKGSADEEACDTIREVLLDGMSLSWDQTLQNALTSIQNGCAVAEIVWEEQDGHISPRKLAPRPIGTLTKFRYDANGGPLAVVQSGYDGAGTWRLDIELPIEKALVFTPYNPSGDLWGLPLLRPMYASHFGRDFVKKQVLIAVEKMAQRIPVATEPYGASETDLGRVLDSIKGIRGGQDSAMIEPYGWTIRDIMGDIPSGQFMLDVLNFFDQDTARIAFATFIMLGSTETGARSLGESFQSLYVAALKGYCQFIAEVLNRYLIPRWVEFNWPGLPDRPKLRFGDPAKLLWLSDLVQTIANLAGIKLITTDFNTENEMRRWVSMPEKDEADIPPPEPPPLPPGQQIPPGPNAPPGSPGVPPVMPAQPKTPGSPSRASAAVVGRASQPDDRLDASEPLPRDLTDREQRFGLERVQGYQDRMEQMLRGKMADLIGKQLSEVSGALKAAVGEAVGGGVRARSRLRVALGALSWPRLAEYRALLTAHMHEVIDAAADLCAEQTQRRPSASQVKDLRSDADTQASMIADQHAAELLFAVRSQVLRDLDGGLSAEAILRNVRQAATDRSTLNLSASLQEATDAVVRRLPDLLR